MSIFAEKKNSTKVIAKHYVKVYERTLEELTNFGFEGITEIGKEQS